MSKEYQVINKQTKEKARLGSSQKGFFKYTVRGDWGGFPNHYNTLEGVEKEWSVPEEAKRSLRRNAVFRQVRLWGAVSLLGLASLSVFFLIFFLMFCVNWDYTTGQDTGYISAVDKMSFSDDTKIYLRRRPLDAQGFTSAEKEETEYCTTPKYPEVVEKAREAMLSGERVILVYDEPKEFGWKKIWGCNSAPITDIRPVFSE